MTRIYLAGPITGTSAGESLDWRNRVKSSFRDSTYPVTCIDPMRRDYRNDNTLDRNSIVVMDKQDILSCDVLLVWFDRASVGTSMEIFFAHQNNIPVVVIAQTKAPLSPWLEYHATTIQTRMLDALKWIQRHILFHA